MHDLYLGAMRYKKEMSEEEKKKGHKTEMCTTQITNVIFEQTQ